MTREEAKKIIGELLLFGKAPCKKEELEDLCKVVLTALEQEPTTKNDLTQERYQDLIEYFGDEKVAKTILESRKEFKAWLERHRWQVKRADELARRLEQINSTNKNDLGVDCISRDAVKYYIQAHIHEIITESGIDKNAHTNRVLRALLNGVDTMPSVTPQEPKTGHWIAVEMEKYSDTYGHFTTHEFKCSNCGGNYIFNYHKYCPNCGAKMVETEDT